MLRELRRPTRGVDQLHPREDGAFAFAAAGFEDLGRRNAARGAGDTPAVVDSKSVSICVAEVLHTSKQTISMLREQGYAVVLFNKDELGNASASALQNRLIELAADEIQYLQPAE